MSNAAYDEPLRVGLVGFGMAGAVFHAPIITGVEGLELAAVVTGRADRAAAAREQHPGAAVVPDLETLLATVRPDLVVIATPNHAHVAQARRALEAGAHVVIDKPVAATAAEARELERLAGKHRRVAAAFHNRRWDSDFLTLRGLLDDGRLGQVRRFESRFERWSPTPSGGWRESDDPATAPGLLYDLGTHLIDQALQLFGPVTRVYAETEVRREGVRAPDDVFVALRHEHDVVSHLWMSKVAASEGPRLRVLGSEAALVVHGLDDQVGPPAEAGRQHAVLTRSGQEESVAILPGRYPDFYRGVVQAIRSGGEAPVTLTEAAAVLDVIERAMLSAHTGTAVSCAA